MQVIETAHEMRAWSLSQRCAGKSIGLVPTMGALHPGHESLMEAAAARDDVSVVSIFVNPAQFAPGEDFDRYPRTWETDCAKAEALNMDVVYAPDTSKMYPEGYATYVQVEGLQDGLCGITRPHFFKGVATVVTKLFHAVQPDRAYFGAKDGQQSAIIHRMTRDLDFGIDICTLPTVREEDGLALSSRNAYLSDEDRARALAISKALFASKERMEQGEQDPDAIVSMVRLALKDVDIDYISLVDAEEMTPVEKIEGRVMLAVAAKVGDTRLIDNITHEA